MSEEIKETLTETVEAMKEEIKLEEEAATQAETNGKSWTEELSVAAGDLVETVKKLLHEVAVRRVIIRHRNGRTLLDIPMVVGVGGFALLPIYAALAAAALLATNHSILVERAEA